MVPLIMKGMGSATPATVPMAEFPSTHWSVVLNAGNGNSLHASSALEELCRAYWLPLYAYLRRRGHSVHDSEDLVQGFLARFLAREDLAGVGPEKGRFRFFLLISLRNFVIKQAVHDKALKRGGGQVPVSIDTEEAERLCGPDLSANSPEEAFDRRFAQSIMSRAFNALRAEHHARGKDLLFSALSSHLDGSEPEGYERVAAELGTTPGAMAVAVHRMRARFRELLRAEIRQLCSTSEEEAQEMKYLLEVWSR